MKGTQVQLGGTKQSSIEGELDVGSDPSRWALSMSPRGLMPECEESPLVAP